MYIAGEPVRVRVRKRGRRYDIDDRGAAAQLAGKSTGWREVAERVVDEDSVDANRAGVVFVGAVGGRDVARLAERIAENSLAVYAALLELEV